MKKAMSTQDSIKIRSHSRIAGRDQTEIKQISKVQELNSDRDSGAVARAINHMAEHTNSAALSSICRIKQAISEKTRRVKNRHEMES